MVIFAGQEMDGKSISLTVTLNEHVAEAPLAAVTLYVTAVVPTEKTAPDAGPPISVVTAPVQLSVPTGSV